MLEKDSNWCIRRRVNNGFLLIFTMQQQWTSFSMQVYPFVSAGCNRTYGGVQGRIYSPEWPTFSPPFSNCVFTINAPNGSAIAMYFNEFLLPDSISCIQGAFEVSFLTNSAAFSQWSPVEWGSMGFKHWWQVRENNGNGRLLARYCGSALPNPIFTTSRTVWVQYFTKGTLSRGYDITYTTTSNGMK